MRCQLAYARAVIRNEIEWLISERERCDEEAMADIASLGWSVYFDLFVKHSEKTMQRHEGRTTKCLKNMERVKGIKKRIWSCQLA
jgi:hypothetical protein